MKHDMQQLEGAVKVFKQIEELCRWDLRGLDAKGLRVSYTARAGSICQLAHKLYRELSEGPEAPARQKGKGGWQKQEARKLEASK